MSAQRGWMMRRSIGAKVGPMAKARSDIMLYNLRMSWRRVDARCLETFEAALSLSCFSAGGLAQS